MTLFMFFDDIPIPVVYLFFVPSKIWCGKVGGQVGGQEDSYRRLDMSVPAHKKGIGKRTQKYGETS